MQKEYDIYLNEKEVGQARVTRQGLYYHISCRCRFHDDQIYRITVRTENTQTNLGICVPCEGWFVVSKKLPVKTIGEGEFQFYAVSKDYKKPFVPVDPNKPFAYLSKIQKACFESNNGQPGILFTDQFVSRRDSDLSP